MSLDPSTGPASVDGLAFGVSALGAWCLALVYGRLGWGDRATAATRSRKLQGRAVPPVGGIALLLGLWAGGGWASLDDRWPGLTVALLALTAVGLLDDGLRGGLSPAAKLALQAAALAPLVGCSGREGLWQALLGLAAVNVLNTFDNADGAAGSLALLGLWPVHPAAVAALAGLLPFNLDARRRDPRGDVPPGAETPSVYLGDSGAYVLGLWLSLHPVGLAALWIPSLDLLRLAVVRTRAGSRPWIGDRRHLAHRLQAHGVRGTAGVLWLLLLGLPGVLGVALEPRHAGAAALGLGLGALLFLVALGLTRGTRGGTEPLGCP